VTPLAALSQDLARLVAAAAPSVVGVAHRRGQGSGLVLAPDGYFLTNAHVVRRGPLAVHLAGGERLPAEVVGADPPTDLAVLRADRRGLAPLPLDESRRLAVGEIVLAIGNPLGFERSVSLGVVSALHRNLPTPDGAPFDDLVQTDAAVNPGNSGGPLLDAEGRVVGITTAMLPWAHGMAFAVPARTAGWIAAVILRTGEVRRPFLGVHVRGEELAPGLARELARPRALRVVEVRAGAPAARGGVRAGDLVVSANGEPVVTLDDLSRAMVLGAPRALALGLLGDGGMRTVDVRPDPAQQAA
jgi:S1-C subfamily serine protease